MTNFDRTLPAPQSELAQQIIKDPYNFDFLSLGSGAKERDLERGLIAQLQKFLLELGVGFSFVGSQYPLEVDGDRLRAHAVLAKDNLDSARRFSERSRKYGLVRSRRT